MTEGFLSYLPDPYGVGMSAYALLKAGEFRSIDAEDIRNAGQVVAFEVSTLIDDLRRNGIALPGVIIDVSDAMRLATGISKADGGEHHWNFWKRSKKHFPSLARWREAQDVFEGRRAQPDASSRKDLLKDIATALGALWSEAQQNLQDADEAERFYQLEVPAAQVFYERQLRGLPVSEDDIEGELKQASHSKYVAYRQVADLIGTSPTGLNYWNVGPFLEKADVDIAPGIDGYYLRDQLKLAREFSPFARQFTTLVDSGRNVQILTRLADASSRVYPAFHPCGTVSARVLVSDPYLQELKKEYRSVISADAGRKLVYLDYAQFEPGIMAALSKDADLISLYESGDIYLALSRALFGDDEHRSICKRCFLAFSYGMSSDRIARLVLGKDAERAALETIQRDIDAFFARFSVLTEFKQSLEQLLLSNGFAATILGNHRRRVTTGKLSPKERRWAVNQVVQGNATLIFKKAVISLATAFGNDALLLPMHDAVLMQFEDEVFEHNSAVAMTIMKDAFASCFSNLSIRVSRSAFTE